MKRVSNSLHIFQFFGYFWEVFIFLTIPWLFIINAARNSHLLLLCQRSASCNERKIFTCHIYLNALHFFIKNRMEKHKHAQYITEVPLKCTASILYAFQNKYDTVIHEKVFSWTPRTSVSSSRFNTICSTTQICFELRLRIPVNILSLFSTEIRYQPGATYHVPCIYKTHYDVGVRPGLENYTTHHRSRCIWIRWNHETYAHYWHPQNIHQSSCGLRSTCHG